MHAEAHVAMRCGDVGIAGTAGDLEMSLGFEFARRAVVDDPVGANDVVAVVKDDRRRPA